MLINKRIVSGKQTVQKEQSLPFNQSRITGSVISVHFEWSVRWFQRARSWLFWGIPFEPDKY